jgi:hypothetical protein
MGNRGIVKPENFLRVSDVPVFSLRRGLDRRQSSDPRLARGTRSRARISRLWENDVAQRHARGRCLNTSTRTGRERHIPLSTPISTACQRSHRVGICASRDMIKSASAGGESLGSGRLAAAAVGGCRISRSSSMYPVNTRVGLSDRERRAVLQQVIRPGSDAPGPAARVLRPRVSLEAAGHGGHWRTDRTCPGGLLADRHGHHL